MATGVPNVTFHANKSGSYYSPIHPLVKNAAFMIDESIENGNEIAFTEANLVDAMARMAEQNGVGINELMHMIPFVLRMLKSNSNWAK